MLNALFTSIISSVCLISSVSVGVSNYLRQDVKEDTNNSIVLPVDSNYRILAHQPYESFLQPIIYTQVGDFGVNRYSSLDVMYSTRASSVLVTGESTASNKVLVGSINYDIMFYYTNGTDNQFLFCQYTSPYDNGYVTFYDNVILINSNLFGSLIYSNFYLDWEYEFINYDYTQRPIVNSRMNCPLNYQGVNVTYNDTVYYAFKIYENPIYYTNETLDYIYNNTVNNTLFTSHIRIRYGLSSGYSDGYTDGYRVGKDEGYETGYRVGYNKGLRDGGAHNYRNIFFAIADTPVLMIRSLFNFDFFGMNFFIIIVSMLTFLFLLFIVKKVVK